MGEHKEAVMKFLAFLVQLGVFAGVAYAYRFVVIFLLIRQVHILEWCLCTHVKYACVY